LAAAIKEAYGIECQLVAGRGGVFDVKADGKLIFSKRDVGRFPENSEVLESLAPLRS